MPEESSWERSSPRDGAVFFGVFFPAFGALETVLARAMSSSAASWASRAAFAAAASAFLFSASSLSEGEVS